MCTKTLKFSTYYQFAIWYSYMRQSWNISVVKLKRAVSSVIVTIKYILFK